MATQLALLWPYGANWNTVTETIKPALFRLLPSVDELLRIAGVPSLAQRFGHAATVEASRAFLDHLRGGDR